MQVGQWCRYETISFKSVMGIGLITDIKNDKVNIKGDEWFNPASKEWEYYKPIKTSDNLVDLIEVGDIVHYINAKNGIEGEFNLISENCISLVKRENIKITAIELHENRVKFETD